MAEAGAGADFHDFLWEVFADEDSDSEFEGFDLDDINANDDRVIDHGNFVDPEQWAVGERPVPNLIFNQTAGLRAEVQDKTSPMAYFELFVRNNDYDDIAMQTNLYARQYLANANLRPHSRFQNWVETDSSEMKKFVAMIFAMGLVRQLDIKEYWTTDPVNATPFFPRVMSRDRFLTLMSFLHLNDNSQYIPRGQEGYNPLFKLGELYSRILDR